KRLTDSNIANIRANTPFTSLVSLPPPSLMYTFSSSPSGVQSFLNPPGVHSLAFGLPLLPLPSGRPLLTPSNVRLTVPHRPCDARPVHRTPLDAVHPQDNDACSATHRAHCLKTCVTRSSPRRRPPLRLRLSHPSTSFFPFGAPSVEPATPTRLVLSPPAPTPPSVDTATPNRLASTSRPPHLPLDAAPR
ncbi:hypothetical protein FB451DRAFT_1236259, partial [Mycena latifolia]